MWLLYAKISCRSVENRRGRPQDGVTVCPGSSLNDDAYKEKRLGRDLIFHWQGFLFLGEVLESSLLFLLLLLLALE